jgi:Zn-dependent peptidase ImmA (M78 family)
MQHLINRFAYLGMVITKWPLAVSGVLIYRRGQWHCLINSEEPITRQRFTFCHEVGHRIFHATKESFFCDAPWTVHDVKERQANHFAALVLMPEESVVPFWEAIKGVAPHELWLSRMATQFGVSNQAMGIRLQQLHLIASI